MRYIRYACIAMFAVALIAVALANRSIVTLKVLPDEVAGLFAVNPSINMPSFLAASLLVFWLASFGNGFANMVSAQRRPRLGVMCAG
jgi:hypothetical protein